MEIETSLNVSTDVLGRYVVKAKYTLQGEEYEITEDIIHCDILTSHKKYISILKKSLKNKRELKVNVVERICKRIINHIHRKSNDDELLNVTKELFENVTIKITELDNGGFKFEEQ